MRPDDPAQSKAKVYQHGRGRGRRMVDTTEITLAATRLTLETAGPQTNRAQPIRYVPLFRMEYMFLAIPAQRYRVVGLLPPPFTLPLQNHHLAHLRGWPFTSLPLRVHPSFILPFFHSRLDC